MDNRDLLEYLGVQQVVSAFHCDLNQLREYVCNNQIPVFVYLLSKLHAFYGSFFKDEILRFTSQIEEYASLYQGKTKNELVVLGYELSEVSEDDAQYLVIDVTIDDSEQFDVFFDENGKALTFSFPSVEACEIQPYVQLLDKSKLEFFDKGKVTITHVVGEPPRHDGCLKAPIEVTEDDLYFKSDDLRKIFAIKHQDIVGGFPSLLPHQMKGNAVKRADQIIKLFNEICVENPIRISLEKLQDDVDLINLSWILAICKKCDSLKDIKFNDMALCSMAEILRSDLSSEIQKMNLSPPPKIKFVDECDLATQSTVDKTITYSLTREVLLIISKLEGYKEYFIVSKQKPGSEPAIPDNTSQKTAIKPRGKTSLLREIMSDFKKTFPLIGDFESHCKAEFKKYSLTYPNQSSFKLKELKIGDYEYQIHYVRKIEKGKSNGLSIKKMSKRTHIYDKGFERSFRTLESHYPK